MDHNNLSIADLKALREVCEEEIERNKYYKTLPEYQKDEQDQKDLDNDTDYLEGCIIELSDMLYNALSSLFPKENKNN